MDLSVLRARARQNLGGSLVHSNWLMGVAVTLVGGLVAGVCSLIFFGPISVGLAVIFLKQARGQQEIRFEDLFLGFSDRFGDFLLLGLMHQIFCFLWAIVPIYGIIRILGYSMCYYIKADNPDMEWRECLDRSTIMMEGHKWEYFLLQLSFLGWALLGLAACCVGIYWVAPYAQAAEANFYEALRAGGSTL